MSLKPLQKRGSSQLNIGINTPDVVGSNPEQKRHDQAHCLGPVALLVVGAVGFYAVGGRPGVPLLLMKPTGQPHEALFWRSGSALSMREGDWKLQVPELPRQDWAYNLAIRMPTRVPTRVAAMKLKLQAWDQAQRKPL